MADYVLPSEYPYKDAGEPGAEPLRAADFNPLLAAVADLASAGGRVPDLEAHPLLGTNTGGAAVGALLAASLVTDPGTPGAVVTGWAVRAGAGTVNARDYGAKGDGATDDTVALQAAITATPEGSTLVLPPGLYRLTSALTIAKNMTLLGAGVYANYDTYAVGGSFDLPTKAPYLQGAVLLQSTAGAHGLVLSGSAKQVNLRNFGIRFADAIRWIDTGHGVYALPSATNGAGHDHGLLDATWDNVMVYGHDGNHYAFSLTNTMRCTLTHLRAWGGGVLEVVCDSYIGNYGNLVVNHPFGQLLAGGTAHGYSFRGRTTSGTSGVLNLVTVIRPQVNSSATSRPGVAAVTNAQHLWRSNDPVTCNNLAVLNADFEAGSGLANPVAFGNGDSFIDPSGIFGASADAASKQFGVFRSEFGARRLMSDMTFVGGNTPAPTGAVGAGAGTGTPSIVINSGSDIAGALTFVAGTAPTAFSDLFTVTLGQLSSFTAVQLIPRNGGAAQVGAYIRSKTATSFVVGTTVAPTAGTTYQWDFVVTR